MDAIIIQQLTSELTLRKKQIETTLELLEEGNTVPFIARYRKEATGELDEVQIRTIEERYNYLVKLSQRKEDVLRTSAGLVWSIPLFPSTNTSAEQSLFQRQ